MRRAASALLLRGAAAGASPLMALGLARRLGAQGFGVFAAMNAVAVLAAAVAVLGQNATILRAADAPDPRGPVRDAAGTVGSPRWSWSARCWRRAERLASRIIDRRRWLPSARRR